MTSEKTPELWDSRTRTLLGDEAVDRLARAHVVVVGTGGVGGYAVETLVRSGVGKLTFVDADVVAPSNLNRQIVALHSALGTPKAILLAERCRDINPDAEIVAVADFLTEENVAEIVGTPDYVVDAIDTVAPKMALIKYCMERRIPIVSSMGAGGRIDPTKIGYFDISETREDGLARAVRQRLKKMGLRGKLAVVASTEAPRRHSVIELEERNKRSSFGTIMAIPAIFGIMLANKVVMKIAQI